MAQNYASRPVTRIASGSAAASALVQISGLKADSQKPGAPSVEDFDAIVSLPLQQLRIQLDAATSDELRGLRFHIGLGKAGTKEANKMLIYDHIAKNRSAAGFESSQFSDLDDDSFADGSHALPPAPALPSFSAIPGVIIPDPMQEDDPWRSSTSRKFIGTPVKSQRGQDVHSGMTPQLQQQRQRLADFLNDNEPSMQPIASPPMPQSEDTASALQALLAGQAALLHGVNDLRANVVTRHQLQAFHELQTTEMRTYVQAELVPVHETFNQFSAQMGLIADRVRQIESHASSDAVGNNRKAVDSSFTKLAVKKFPEKMPLEDRLEIMRNFMDEHFPSISASFGVKHRGDWKDRGQNRCMTGVGIIDVGDADLREFVLKTIDTKKLTMKGQGHSLVVTRALTDKARDRNTAIFSAVELLKKKGGVSESDIVINWENRAVEVCKEEVFKQPKGQGAGSFKNKFGHVELA